MSWCSSIKNKTCTWIINISVPIVKIVHLHIFLICTALCFHIINCYWNWQFLTCPPAFLWQQIECHNYVPGKHTQSCSTRMDFKIISELFFGNIYFLNIFWKYLFWAKKMIKVDADRPVPGNLNIDFMHPYKPSSDMSDAVLKYTSFSDTYN